MYSRTSHSDNLVQEGNPLAVVSRMNILFSDNYLHYYFELTNSPHNT